MSRIDTTSTATFFMLLSETATVLRPMQSATVIELRMAANPTTEKLWDLLSLSPGWHFGEGEAIPWSLVHAALDLHRTALASGFLETDVFPGVNGEVRITMYRGKDYYEATVESNGSVTVLHEVDDAQKVCREGLSIHDAARFIEIAGRGEIWRRFALPTLGTTMFGEGGSTALPSGTMEHLPPFLSFQPSASASVLGSCFVNTFDGSTLRDPVPT